MEPRRVERAGHVPVTVYWQRRAVLGLILVLLAALVWMVVAAWRGRTASAEPLPTVSSSITTSAGSTPVPAPSASSSVQPTADAPPVTCDVAQLVLRLSGPTRVKAGSEAALVTTITNVGVESCTLPLNSQTFLLQITSGSDLIWSSTSCAGWGPDTSTVLSTGQTFEWTKTWDRRRASKCVVSPSDLLPGTYVATASWRDGPQARHVMTLTW